MGETKYLPAFCDHGVVEWPSADDAREGQSVIWLPFLLFLVTILSFVKLGQAKLDAALFFFLKLRILLFNLPPANRPSCEYSDSAFAVVYPAL
jgi:hypothetical protein